MLDRGALPEQAATYLVRTIPSGDRFVVATLRRAAERSFAQGAPEAAAAYLRRALEEPPDSDDRAEVLAELGFAETHTDAVAAAEHLSQAIAELERSNAANKRRARLCARPEPVRNTGPGVGPSFSRRRVSSSTDTSVSWPSGSMRC